SQAMLMDAGEDKEAHPGSSPVAVKAFQEAYGRFEGIGKTGEIIMGARQGNTIVFWVTQRMQGSELPVTSWDSPLGEPMRQALSGRTGALVGLDYRGQQVLAAHVPVQNGHMGLVAKIDQAGMFAGSVAVAGVMLGAWLFFGITNPVIRRLEKEIERREAAQAALTQSREDLSQAQEVAHVGNWVWEIPADTVRWSAETYRIFGFRPGEPANPAGQFEKVVHPEDWPRVDRAINAALDEDKPFEIEHRVVWPDGTERHVFGRGRVERDASGRPVKLVGTVQDITLRKRAQEALQRVTLEKEKIESELEFARLVQEGFLPEKPPSPEGYLFAAKSVPAKFIGGDFYDFIDLGRKRLGVVLGDVSGKGVSAALFMAQLLSDFRYVSLMDPDPSQILSRVNDIQCRRSRRGMFATGVYMFMDLERHVLRVANAGHPRALLRSAAGEIRREGVVGGVPLGILPGSRYPVWDLRLQRGDTMLLFTDGVHEAFNADQELFGLKRLENILAAHEGTPEELIMRVEDAVSRHRRPRDPTDDLTMVAFKFL
ncbi:MAG: PP2C family protein-serine/threonine phosphatase, partial [Nitrospinaceae bacterium]